MYPNHIDRSPEPLRLLADCTGWTTCGRATGRLSMLLTIAVILFVLWALGVFAFKLTAGVIHIVLVIALIVGLVHLFRGRRA